MGSLITRRQFGRTSAALAATAMAPGWLAAAPDAREARSEKPAGPLPRYRAVSWWLTWSDLAWPNQDLIDHIRRRADQCVASGVNACVIFGAHLRWDFLPLWDRLHDELRFIAEELRQREMVLWDHHSSVLTHRPRNREEALSIAERNRHHVPFYPSLAEAAERRYNGSLLNDWRMIDVETGAPCYLKEYNAEQFCMNNPAFRASYGRYLVKLKADTGINGLMTDDGIFYPGWRACACVHCRERFKSEFGHDLPPVADAGFWGNRLNPAFRDWITMRFRSSGDFLAVAREAVGPGFPLLTCCSSSDGWSMPSLGMSYQDFIRYCDHVMLEMVGSTPSLAGGWDDRIASQLLQMGIARDHRAPCIGLGYGFFPDTAFFVWAVNKFLGSDCWFSTLKGRLNATPAQLAPLRDDAELVGECYRWEKAHPRLFEGAPDAAVAVYFSRATRDYYGQVNADYGADYEAACVQLTRHGVVCEVVTEPPEFGRVQALVLSSAICLSAEQRRRLANFIEAGGWVVATGPTGFCHENGVRLERGWLEDFKILTDFVEPERPGGYPPYANFPKPVALAQCRVRESNQIPLQEGWFTVALGRGGLAWRPERFPQKGIAGAVEARLRSRLRETLEIEGLPEGWRTRRYRSGNRILIHALPGFVETVPHPELRNHINNERIVEKLVFKPLSGSLTVVVSGSAGTVSLHSPDLPEARPASAAGPGRWQLSLDGLSRYFILEVTG